MLGSCALPSGAGRAALAPSPIALLLALLVVARRRRCSRR
jgi:hypothetical protein